MNFLQIAFLALLLQNTSPSVLNKVPAVYPALAKAARIEGNVQLSVSVNPDGRVADARVVNSPSPILNGAAVEAVRQWRFETTPNGGTATIEISFAVSNVHSGDVITGQVLNLAGEPIANIPVYAKQFSFSRGRRGVSTSGTAYTDDRGVYRIFTLEPGEYFVMAHYDPPTGYSSRPDEDYATDTYFPGTTDVESAEMVTVRARQESVANFSLRTTNHIKIAGKVVPAAGAGSTPRFTSPGLSQSHLYLVPHSTNGDDFGLVISQAVDVVAGASEYPFEIPLVAPGLYDLFAQFRDGNTFYAGRTTVNARNGNLDGVLVPIHPGIELKGDITIESDASTRPVSPMRITFGPKENNPLTGSSPSVAANSDGSFSTTVLSEGRYGVMSVLGLPADAYVSEIRMGDSILTDGILNVVSSSPAEIHVMVSRNGNTIHGTVHDAMQRPVFHADITLVPDAPHREDSLLYKRINSEPDGSFTLRGIAPGDYRLFAWENLPPTADENPAFIAGVEHEGVEIHITPGIASPNFSLSAISTQP